MNSTTHFQDALGLSSPPIAIGFSDQPPAGLEKWQGGAVPAGCVFWREAMKGRSFYTEPADHYNCAVGAYTHAIEMPADRATQLGDTLNLLVTNEYLRMEEVPGIPVLPKTPAFICYGPVETAAFPYQLVLIAAMPASAMLIYEAALRSGAGKAVAGALGRPACAVLPMTQNSGQTSLSLGCMGNRTFTALPADEMYVCIPGQHWQGLLSKISEISKANCDMQQFYRERVAQFATM